MIRGDKDSNGKRLDEESIPVNYALHDGRFMHFYPGYTDGTINRLHEQMYVGLMLAIPHIEQTTAAGRLEHKL